MTDTTTTGDMAKGYLPVRHHYLCLLASHPPTDRLTIGTRDELTIQNATLPGRLRRQDGSGHVHVLAAARVTIVRDLPPGAYLIDSPAWPATPFVFAVT